MRILLWFPAGFLWVWWWQAVTILCGCNSETRAHRTTAVRGTVLLILSRVKYINFTNAVSALLHPEHGTLYRYISVRQPSADNSSSLGSKLISSNAPTYDFYLRELLRSELTYLLTYFCLSVRNDGITLELDYKQWLKWFCEAGGSSDEARLEQTPYTFQLH